MWYIGTDRYYFFVGYLAILMPTTLYESPFAHLLQLSNCFKL
jgi:hypothetical protein